MFIFTGPEPHKLFVVVLIYTGENRSSVIAEIQYMAYCYEFWIRPCTRHVDNKQFDDIGVNTIVKGVENYTLLSMA